MIIGILVNGIIRVGLIYLIGYRGVRHINLCRVSNAESIFIRIMFPAFQFSMSTQFNCQKD